MGVTAASMCLSLARHVAMCGARTSVRMTSITLTRVARRSARSASAMPLNPARAAQYAVAPGQGIMHAGDCTFTMAPASRESMSGKTARLTTRPASSGCGMATQRSARVHACPQAHATGIRAHSRRHAYHCHRPCLTYRLDGCLQLFHWLLPQSFPSPRTCTVHQNINRPAMLL